MYLIIEWNISPKNAWIVLEDDNSDECSNAVFNTEKEAQNFADKHCAFNCQIVKLG
jgi:hypothetical protein